jgi:tRNA-splicing ligase RtcB (3'-phosphate/5'-hydroxy nucleic acid ligase)
MMNVIENCSLKVKSWCPELEPAATVQAFNLARLPFVYKLPCLMPDAHVGYGMPIGGVLATEGVVIPNAVGVDIGCGMAYMSTTLLAEEVRPKLKDIMGDIRRAIPVGMNHHKEGKPLLGWEPNGVVTEAQHSAACKQIGTLGGGNHFIEVQQNESGIVNLMLHSGSRNLGLQVAKMYNDGAKRMNEKWFSKVDPAWDLAFLPLDDMAGQQYMAEMQSAVDFAVKNRMAMMLKLNEILQYHFPNMWDKGQPVIIQSPHNFARQEHHGGRNVIVHRKGATPAYPGQVCIIPGSQGTASYIGEGLGNPESFMSCSHGAGRKMGRKAACRDLDLTEQQAMLDAQGIVHSVRNTNDLEEAPGAYKDIESVMQNQADLVRPVQKLTPMGVIKG